MTIYQLKDGYRYNSDTMFLYDFISKANIKGDILDVGAGCGVLGILLKRDFKDISVCFLEIQSKNLELIRKNLSSNGMDCDIISADFVNFKSDKRFDFIVSNPPFYHDGVKRSQNEHKSISRYAINLSLENLIKNANSHLKPHGALIFCYDAKQIDQICYLLKIYKFNVTKLAFVYSKYGKNASLVLVEAKKSSKSFCEILTPYYVFDGNKYSKEAGEIFKRANLISIDD